MSWADMALAVKAMDSYITSAVQAKNVTKQVMEMAKVKEYLETFKPEETNKLSEQETLAKLMAKYGIVPSALNDSASPITPIVIEELEQDVELTDDERYDLLKLKGESSYTEDDKVFMLNTGTMIMMRRARTKPVNEKDL